MPNICWVRCEDLKLSFATYGIQLDISGICTVMQNVHVCSSYCRYIGTASSCILVDLQNVNEKQTELLSDP